MPLDPIQMLAAFVAACLVLALARMVKPVAIPLQFSLASLLIVMTVFAVVFGLACVYLQK